MDASRWRGIKNPHGCARHTGLSLPTSLCIPCLSVRTESVCYDVLESCCKKIEEQYCLVPLYISFCSHVYPIRIRRDAATMVRTMPAHCATHRSPCGVFSAFPSVHRTTPSIPYNRTHRIVLARIPQSEKRTTPSR